MSVPGDATYPPRSKGFLGLVPRIRELIYLHAGVITNSTVPLDKENSVKRHGRTRNLSEARGPRQDWSTTLALIQTCQPVYAEVSALIYSTNRFITHDLRPLRNLWPSSIHSLSNLKIHVHTRLDVVTVNNGSGRCRNYCDRLYSGYNTGKLLDRSDPADAAILDEWAATASHIGSGIRAGQLDFSLICDVGNVETANLVVAPLLQWPQLSRCSIRLNNRPDTALGSLARDTSRNLMHSQTLTSFPRYWELPLELRLRVLQYTDLVTPWTEVSWLPSSGYSRPLFRCCQAGRTVLAPTLENPQHLNDATNLATYRKDYRIFGHSWDLKHFACQFQPCSRMKVWHSGTGCFCGRFHAAYSPTCSCWRPPTNLFLVSTAFYREAALTFFCSNHLRIGIDIDPDSHIGAAGSFLSGLASANIVSYLRSLRLEFSSHYIETQDVIKTLFGQCSQDSNTNVRLEWRRTIALISSASNLRYLEISIEWIDGLTDLSDWWTLDSETLFRLARKIIDARFWSLCQGGAPQGVRQLMVHMRCHSRPNLDVSVWYNIREKQEELPSAKRYWGEDSEYPYETSTYRRATHSRSLEVVEGTRVTTWIENIWLSGATEEDWDPFAYNRRSFDDMPTISLL